jgi:HPr kinase/phosphorylase
MTAPAQRIHGSSVEIAGQGILILGPSGAGKSSLARDLIVLGATLVADDQTVLTRDGSSVLMSRPPSLPAGLELRGIGIVACPMVATASLDLVVDLSQREPDRIPPTREYAVLDLKFRLIYGAGLDGLAQSLYLYLNHGRLQI